jgi:hypothetical protein
MGRPIPFSWQWIALKGSEAFKRIQADYLTKGEPDALNSL